MHIHADNVQFRRSLLAGCADALFVLKKSNRTQGNATLFCTGRDIEDREIELAFSKEDCTWKMTADSAENPNMLLPDEMNLLIEMMKAKKYFSGSNAEFLERYNAYSGKNLSARILKRIKIINQINRERMMKEYRQSATA